MTEHARKEVSSKAIYIAYQLIVCRDAVIKILCRYNEQTHVLHMATLDDIDTS